jgi:cytochrome oxidase Cu insertion factor (SCO1/SenC/PrrC family)
MTATHTSTPAGSSSPPPPSRRPYRPWLYALIGITLGAVLAVVLFVGVGTGTPSASPTVQTMPGVNQPASEMISLSVLPRVSANAAPNFTLTDQHGRPVSLSEFRGKVVVVSANDDQCQDLCTFLANDIVAANRDLGPAARHVVWLSVNANPFYPQVSSVAAWTDQHGLGDQANWYFTTGTAAQLAHVWRLYGVYVEQDAKTRSVTHSAQMFYVDPSGQERAVTSFGTAAANTALFAHSMAQVADDLLPPGQRVTVAGPQTPPASAGGATLGASLPPFTLPYLDGRGRFPSSALGGRFSVVNFWSSTCTVCRTELPSVEAAYRFAGKQVTFLGIDVSDQVSPARAMAARAGLTYPLVSDSSGTTTGAARVTGLPFTLVLDPSRHVLIRHPGDITTEQLEYLLETYVPALAPAG